MKVFSFYFSIVIFLTSCENVSYEIRNTDYEKKSVDYEKAVKAKLDKKNERFFENEAILITKLELLKNILENGFQPKEQSLKLDRNLNFVVGEPNFNALIVKEHNNNKLEQYIGVGEYISYPFTYLDFIKEYNKYKKYKVPIDSELVNDYLQLKYLVLLRDLDLVLTKTESMNRVFITGECKSELSIIDLKANAVIFRENISFKTNSHLLNPDDYVGELGPSWDIQEIGSEIEKTLSQQGVEVEGLY